MIAAIPVVNAAFAVETFLDGTRTDEERISSMLEDGEFLVAEEIAQSADEGTELSQRIVAAVYVERNGPRGYFGMLAVDPSRQGTGLGRRMVDAAEEYLRNAGCTHMDIFVLSLRPELPPFYRKLGYVDSGTEEFRPSRSLRAGLECHCIIMSKQL